jgi:hypothetical protein
MFHILRNTMNSFMDFLEMNKGFLENVTGIMDSASSGLTEAAGGMADSTEVLALATNRFGSMAQTISAIVRAQKNLGDLDL